MYCSICGSPSLTNGACITCVSTLSAANQIAADTLAYSERFADTIQLVLEREENLRRTLEGRADLETLFSSHSMDRLESFAKMQEDANEAALSLARELEEEARSSFGSSDLLVSRYSAAVATATDNILRHSELINRTIDSEGQRVRELSETIEDALARLARPVEVESSLENLRSQWGATVTRISNSLEAMDLAGISSFVNEATKALDTFGARG